MNNAQQRFRRHRRIAGPRRHEQLHRLEALGGLEIYAGCTERELTAIDLLGVNVDVLEGRVLMREGAPGREFTVLIEGCAAVSWHGEELAIVGPGSFVGEMALLDGARRTATAVALTPARLCVMTADEFDRLQRLAPSVREQITRTAAERLAANARGFDRDGHSRHLASRAHLVHT